MTNINVQFEAFARPSPPPQTGAGEAVDIPTAVVSVNGDVISSEDIYAEMQHHPADTPGEAWTQSAKALVIRKLLLDEAERLAIPGSRTSADGSPDTTDEESVIGTLLSDNVAMPSATQEECRRFYDNNPDRFLSEELLEVRHILISKEKEAESRKTGQGLSTALIQTLQNDPNAFSSLAQEYSICPSGRDGGKLGLVTRGSTVPEFENRVFSSSALGLIDAPVESRYGFHIVTIDNREPGRVLPFERVHEKLAGWLDASTWSTAVTQYVHILARNASIAGVTLGETEN